MGLPGFSGFVAELQVLLGAWAAFPSLALLTGLGIVIGAAYALRALQKAFFGDGRAARAADAPLEPISVPERIGAALLMATSLGIGLYPRLLLDLIDPALRSGLFDGIWKAAGL
jgi:NADH-quinone oxidoreductase subunit M